MGIFSLRKKDEKEDQFRQRIDEMLGKLLDENMKGRERLEKLSYRTERMFGNMIWH